MPDRITLPVWPAVPATWVEAPAPGPGKHKFPGGKAVQSERGALSLAANVISSVETFAVMMNKDTDKKVSQFQISYFVERTVGLIDDHLEYMERPLPKNYVHQYRIVVWNYMRAVQDTVYVVMQPYADELEAVLASRRLEAIAGEERLAARAEKIVEGLRNYEGPFKNGKPKIREFRVFVGLVDLKKRELKRVIAKNPGLLPDDTQEEM